MKVVFGVRKKFNFTGTNRWKTGELIYSEDQCLVSLLQEKIVNVQKQQKARQGLTITFIIPR